MTIAPDVRPATGVAPSSPASQPVPDLSICDREPIHIPGSIQPRGALLTVRLSDFLITQASANLASVLGWTADMSLGRPFHEVLGRPLQEVLGHEVRLAVENFISRDVYEPHNVFYLGGLTGTQLSLRAHRSGALICVEIEALAQDLPGARSSVSMAQNTLTALTQATSLNELCAMTAGEFKALTGYDRVLVYRFDEDGNGEVVGEALEPFLAPFLGLHYPATDIPLQARRIFLRQRVRLIADIAYEPVPVLCHPTLHDGVPLDMTLCALRAVSPAHVEYLGNMGVTASFSLALTHSDKLWGLVVGHHGLPRWMDTEHRAAIDILGQVMASLLQKFEGLEIKQRETWFSNLMRSLGPRLVVSASLGDALAAPETELLRITQAEGAMIRVAGHVRCIGKLPAEPDALQAMAVLSRDAGRDLLAVKDLGLRYPELASCIRAGSGALLLPLSPATDDAILWFRPEALQTVIWGGDPNKPTGADASNPSANPGSSPSSNASSSASSNTSSNTSSNANSNANSNARLSPRKSFEAWKELTRGHALRWSSLDLACARELLGVIKLAEATHKKEQQRLLLLQTLELEANLLAGAVELVSSQAETVTRASDLLVSQRLNKTLGPASDRLTAGERAMHESETRFCRAVEAALSAIVIVNGSGMIWLVNSQAESMFGYPRDELLGKAVETLVPERFRGRHPALREAFSTHAVQSRPMGAGRDLFGLRKDGTEFPVEVGLTPIETDKGAMVLSKILDISERQKNELMREQQRQDLERSNADLEEFAYIASHDLKEPLRGIANNARFLYEDYAEKLDQAGIKRLFRLGYLSQRMEQLINELLHFAQLGHPEPLIEQTDLNGVIHEIEMMSETILSELNAVIVIPRELPIVLCNKLRITEVFRNLISNAVKYNDRAARQVEIGYIDDVKRNNRFEKRVFYVKDNGIGIAKEFQEEVFRIFKRLNLEEDDKRGTGVGLTFVRRIVERDGGQVWLDSTPGEGSTFYFTMDSGIGL